MPPEVILVGNGTSVLDAANGPIIDRCGTVVRFNLYEMKGFEKHVGAKTDIWFCGLPMKPDNWRMQQSYHCIYAHSWQRDPNLCTTFKSIVEAHPSKVLKVNHAIFPEMSRFADTDYRYWSTGAIAVWMMARQFPVVYLTGFDWWDRAQQHYFRPNANRGTLHKPEIEKTLIDWMQTEGRVAFL